MHSSESDKAKADGASSKYTVQIGEGKGIAIGDHARVEQHYHISRSAEEKKDATNRKIMLDRVERIWITSLLEKSLYKQVQILLGLEEQPHAVTNPWQLQVQELDTSTGPLPTETTIQHVYDRAGGTLLILGEPGSGKTTLLLELLRSLIEQARRDDTSPLPVIFNLSSWISRRAPLDIWFVEELSAKYQIPRQLAQQWVRQSSILPLLDGLDEVVPQMRADCVQAINDYLSISGLVSLVVCSRRAEYDQLIAKTQQKLDLRTAVFIQPLTGPQIDDYLSQAGPSLSVLNNAIQKNSTLQELITTPLMLSVLVLAYQNTPPDALQITDVQQIFTQYIQQMLTRRKAKRYYTNEQLQKWLASLARQMLHQGQTEFYLDQIQRNWFPHLKLYRLCIGLTFGFIVGFFIFFIYVATFFFNSGPWLFKLGGPLLYGLVSMGMFTLFYGVILNWVDPSTPPAKHTHFFIKKQLGRFFNNPLLYGLLLGACHGILVINIGAYYAILHGIFFGIGYALIGRADIDVSPAEAVRWSWLSIRTNLLRFFGSGLLFGFLFGLSSGPITTLITSYRLNDQTLLLSVFNWEQIVRILLTGALVGIGFGMIFALIGGITYTSLDKKKHIAPNQGIRSSARNALILGLSSGLLVGLIAALIFGPIQTWTNATFIGIYPLVGVGWGIGVGIAVLAVVSMRNGGVFCLQHYLLCFLLWRSGSLPPRLITFLDEATERILLHRVGGGYRFIHQLFLEHFAALAPVTAQVTQDIATASPEIASPQPPVTQFSQIASPTESKLPLPIQGIRAEWFVRLGLIGILVFCGFIAVSFIDANHYRLRIVNEMAHSPYPEIFPGKGKISLFDPLDEPNYWYNSSTQDPSFCQFADNTYHLHEKRLFASSYCHSSRTFRDLAFSVNMTIIQGDCGGIILPKVYKIHVCVDGRYSFYYDDLGAKPKLDSRIMKLGLKQSNTLAIVVHEHVATLFINNQKIEDTPNIPSVETSIGLLATNLASPATDVVYQNAKAWTF